MLQDWTPQAIKFLQDAGEYHPEYYDLLAGKVLFYARDRHHVCDAGCGTGGLSLALAGFCRHLTAVDCAPRPLALLREQVWRRGVGNVTVCCQEVAELQPEAPYSAMVFCQFGDPRMVLDLARRLCRGTVVLITRNYENRQFSLQPTARSRYGRENCGRVLEACGVPYESQLLTVEFGQPFRSLQDAVAFFRLYNPGQAVTEKAVETRLVQTGRRDFPLYLPKQKRLGIFAFQSGDIPQGEEGAVSGVF